jgi:pilus assembly protein CpaB
LKTNRKGLIFVIAGILVVMLGVLLVGRLVQSMLIPAATPPPPTPVKESVLVTARGIPLGTVFGPADLTTIQLPVELVPLNRLTDPNQVVGKVALAPMVAGEMVLPHRVADASNVIDKTLAVEIGDDQVLLAFPILDLMSQLNILKKGDVVDIFITMPTTVQTGGTEGEEKTFTFDAMQRITITAIVMNVVTEQAPTPTPVAVLTPGAAQTPQPPPEPVRTSTQPIALLLALAPQDALVLKNLKDSGAIFDLVLRSPTSTELFETMPVTDQYLIERYQLEAIP